MSDTLQNHLFLLENHRHLLRLVCYLRNPLLDAYHLVKVLAKMAFSTGQMHLIWLFSPALQTQAVVSHLLEWLFLPIGAVLPLLLVLVVLDPA